MKQFVKKQWINITYFVFVAVVIMLMITHDNSGYDDLFVERNEVDFSKDWYYSLYGGACGMTNLPNTLPWNGEDKLVLTNTIPDIDQSLSFFFRAKHTAVRITVAGEVRVDTISNRSDWDYWLNMSGNTYQEVQIEPSDSGESIMIESISPMPRYIKSPGTVYLGDRGTLFLRLVRENSHTIVCAILLFFLAGILLALWVANVLVLKNKTGEILCLALFSASVAIWLVTECDCMQFFMHDTGSLSLIAYEDLMLISVPISLYFYYYSDREYIKKITKCVAIAPLVLFVINNALHQFRIVPLSESLVITQAMLGVNLVIVAYTQVTEIRYKSVVKEGYSTAVWSIPLIGIAILTPLASAEVIKYAFFPTRFKNDGILLSVGVIVYMCSLACDTVVRMKYRSEKYRESSDIKSQFLANMSHEIRTPLNAILGFNEVILRKSRSKIIKNYALEIQSAGNNLKAIINSILDISKIESGKLEIYSVEYNTVNMLDNVVSMFETLAKKKGLKLNVDIDPKIPVSLIGDENHITQIITNIMSNAVKYTEKGTVTLQVKVAEMPEDLPICKLGIAVTDTGIGIKEEDLSKLFDKFSRFDREKNYSIEGTGLGMNIVGQLLHAMGSEIKVESVYGEGSTFSFEIEQSVVDRNEIGSFQDRRDERANGNLDKFDFIAPNAEILVVDDVQMNLDTASALLEQYEVKVDTASSGKDAINKIINKHYDLVLMDHMMPEMDGVQATEYIRNLAVEREDVYFAMLPIIALTANAVVGMKEHFLQAGMQDFVSKPIDVTVLNEAIKKWLPKDKIVPVKKKDIPEETEQDETDDWGPVPEEFDRESAKKYCPQYKLFLTNIRTYAGNFESTSAKLRQFRDESDVNNYMIVVHGLKSTSKMIGKNDIYEFALSQEMYCRNNLPELVWPETESLLEMYEECCKKIRAFLGEDDSAKDKGESMAADDYTALLKRVKEAAESFDMGAFMELEEEFDKISPPEDKKAEFETIRSMVANAEFSEVGEVLKDI